MRCFTGVFHFTSHFSSRFGYQHVGIQNASENKRKMQEKRKKNPKHEPSARKCLYITLRVGQKGFGRVLVAFWLCFGRDLVVFWW